jgi:hypothetical protein
MTAAESFDSPDTGWLSGDPVDGSGPRRVLVEHAAFEAIAGWVPELVPGP